MTEEQLKAAAERLRQGNLKEPMFEPFFKRPTWFPALKTSDDAKYIVRNLWIILVGLPIVCTVIYLIVIAIITYANSCHGHVMMDGSCI